MLRWTLIVVVAIALSAPASSRGDEQQNEEQIPVLEGITTVDTILVTGSTSILSGEIPGSIHRIGLAELRKQNLAYDDIHRILFRLPGINIQEEDGYGLRPNIGMRGTGVDRSANITLMEDAVLIAPAPYAAPSAYYFPVTGRMSEIEVRKGSSQIKYGPRTNGGALNLVSTPVPKESAIRGIVAGGEDNTKKLYANYGDTRGRVGWLLETYQIENDGFKRLDTGGVTGFDVADYIGKVEFTTTATASVFQKLTLKGGYTDETSYETYLGLTDRDFVQDPQRRYAASQNDIMKSEHRQYQARYLVMPSGWSAITTTAYRNEFKRNWYKLDKVGGVSIANILEDPATYATEFSYITADSASPDNALDVKANNRTYYSQGVDSQLRLSGQRWSMHHETEIGVRLHADEEDRFQHSDQYRIKQDGVMELTTQGIPGASGGGNNRVNSARALAAYIQENASAGRWIVTAGLRYEHIELKRAQYDAGDPERSNAPSETWNTIDVLVPGIGVSYGFAGESSVFAGAHKGFSPPGPGTDQNTKPEESVNYELGGRYSNRRLHVHALGFFNDYQNLLGRDTFSGGGSGSGDLYNAGSVHTYGLEASLGLELLRSSAWQFVIPVTLAYTYTVAEFQTSFQSGFGPWGDVEKGDRVPYVPEHQLSGSISVERNRLNVGLFATHASRTPTEAFQGAVPPNKSIDARTIVDVTADFAVLKMLSLFASVQNITDETYVAARRPAGVRPGLPRRYMLGLKVGL